MRGRNCEQERRHLPSLGEAVVDKDRCRARNERSKYKGVSHAAMSPKVSVAHTHSKADHVDVGQDGAEYDREPVSRFPSPFGFARCAKGGSHYRMRENTSHVLPAEKDLLRRLNNTLRRKTI